jgi:hypothetical protein
MIFLASSLVVSHWQRDYDTIFLLILTKPWVWMIKTRIFYCWN